MAINRFSLGTLFIAAQAFWAGALAQEKAERSTTYRIQLSEISVQSPRSRRTDTNYAAISVQVGTAAPQTVTRRLGDVGRGTKAVNMSFPQVVIGPKTRLSISWAVVNYGGERHDAMMRLLRKATEDHVKAASSETWISQLSDLIAIEDARDQRCDGPVLASSFDIGGAELARQLGSGKPLRVTRRQRGLDAPRSCTSRSDYFATVIIVRQPPMLRRLREPHRG